MNQQDSAEDSHIEIEGKWRLDEDSEQRIRALLKQNGGIAQKRYHEVNQLFDNRASEYKNAKKLLRLRYIEEEHQSIFTYKGPPEYVDGVKKRQELEIHVDDYETTKSILLALGFIMTLEYSKVREIWLFRGTQVAFDELPFGYYCEIEGSLSAIRTTADILGLDFNSIELRDYPTLLISFKQ